MKNQSCGMDIRAGIREGALLRVPALASLTGRELPDHDADGDDQDDPPRGVEIDQEPPGQAQRRHEPNDRQITRDDLSHIAVADIVNRSARSASRPGPLVRSIRLRFQKRHAPERARVTSAARRPGTAGSGGYCAITPRRASSPSRSSSRVGVDLPPGTVQKISNSSPSGSLAYSDRLTPWFEEPTSAPASVSRRRARTRSVMSATSQAEWYIRATPSSGRGRPDCSNSPR